MHAWESIQRVVDYIETDTKKDFRIEELADIACLSPFYFQRLFSRLVKSKVFEYIKLRRLAGASEALMNKENRILDIALDYGFCSHETFTRNFKEVYGITPSQYRDNYISLHHFDKPDLKLSYVINEEGVPLISDGLVLEMNINTLDTPVKFLGVEGIFQFKKGKMLGERPGIDTPGMIWEEFFSKLKNIPCIFGGRQAGISYQGNAPNGYSTYFAGAEVEKDAEDDRFKSWELPAREYVVCGFEAENMEQLTGTALGRAMKYTRLWLKKHGLIAISFFPEIYYPGLATPYMELWIPFRKRS